MIAAEFPSLSIETLWHVGTMDPTAKKDVSYEGRGLSVSVHPEDWTAIARLGGSTTWELSRRDAAFLDHHALSAEHRAQIDAWGQQQGYITPAIRWTVSFFDEDLDASVTMHCDTAEDAAFEAEVRWTEDDEEVSPVEVTVMVATPAFPDHTVREGESAIAEPLAALWVSAHRPDLDGVWFADRHDPAMLSCPRGVIAPERLATWTVTRATT